MYSFFFAFQFLFIFTFMFSFFLLIFLVLLLGGSFQIRNGLVSNSVPIGTQITSIDLIFSRFIRIHIAKSFVSTNKNISFERGSLKNSEEQRRKMRMKKKSLRSTDNGPQIDFYHHFSFFEVLLFYYVWFEYLCNSYCNFVPFSLIPFVLLFNFILFQVEIESFI